MSLPAFPEQLRPVPAETRKQITISTTAVVIATANGVNPNAIRFMLVEVQTNGVSVRFDGGTPTAGDGHLLAAGYREVWSAEKWNQARMIRSGGADAVVYASAMTI